MSEEIRYPDIEINIGSLQIALQEPTPKAIYKECEQFGLNYGDVRAAIERAMIEDSYRDLIEIDGKLFYS